MLQAVLALVTLFFLAASVWSVLFGATLLLVVFLACGCVFVPVLRPGWWKLRIGAVAMLLCAALAIGPVTAQINRRIDRLGQIDRTADAARALSIRTKLAIYGLNLGMALVAAPLYPEVAMETFLMVRKTRTGFRVFGSKFALRSSRVRAEITRFLQSSEPRDRVTVVIDWPEEDYLIHEEGRVALALNATTLTIAADRTDVSGVPETVQVELRTSISYPHSGRIQVLSKPALFVEEGLFWMLEQAGWLHPYTVVYRFTAETADLLAATAG